MSPPQYNKRIILLETKAFWGYPICRGSTGQKWFMLGHATKHTQRPSHHGRCRWKWPPNTPHYEASDWWATTPQASRYVFWGGWRVNISQSTPLFWQWCDASLQHWSVLRDNTPIPLPPQNLYPLAWGSLPIEQSWRCGAQVASCAALGDHFRQRHCLMVIVDRWHQIIFIPT